MAIHPWVVVFDLSNILTQPCVAVFLQAPIEKRPRVDGSLPHGTEEGGPRSERLQFLQVHDLRGEVVEAWAVDGHMLQGLQAHTTWKPSRHIAYRESISDAIIGDPIYENNGDQPYIPNVHQQSWGQAYIGGQQHGSWSHEESPDYD